MHKQRIEAYGKDFSFLRSLSGNSDKLCIYGAGVNGEVICEYLRQLEVDIDFFVDKQAEIREFSVLGKNVIAPTTFFAMSDDYKIIGSPDNQELVLKYLNESGIREEQIISPFKKVQHDIYLLSNDYDPRMNCDLLHQSEATCTKNADVTVFTIMYNTPHELLCRTIESVLSQTYQNFAYLVVDNGSTDGSDYIVKLYADRDKRIKYVRLNDNVVWASRIMLQTLKENVNTEYVAMLDSDDYYMPTFLETTIGLARNDNAEMIQVNTLTYAHKGFKYSYYTHYWGEQLMLEGQKKEDALLMRILFVPVWGKLLRTTLFQKLVDMMLSYKTDEERDRNFCLDISWITYMTLECKRAVLCDDILHIRTWRSGSSEHSDDHSSKWLSSIIWSFNHLRERGIDYERSTVYEESQLMWLFGLKREKFGLNHFRKSDLEYARVKEFLNRPICDKFRGN